MATNFEVYKDEIQKCLSENNIAIKNNKPVKCVGDCNSCIRDSEIGICMDKPLFEWLYAEHIEQPKLTKRERAFCEAFKTGWIAKDESDVVCWYANPPIKGDGMWIETGVPVKTEMQIPIDFWFFDFIKWSDEEPWSVADLLKLEVIEVQHETD